MISKWIPLLFIFAILALVLAIVLREDKSLITKFAQMISRNIEGFAPMPVLENPRCPDTSYTFFTDRLGDSFCCRGNVNAFTHTCSAGDDNGMCAFRPGMPDPRNRHRILPLCSSLITDNHLQQQASCPGSLPNYASIGKCCLSNPDLDDYDCMPSDNKDFKRYCKIKGPLLPGEQLCSNVNMMETVQCPSQIPDMITYKTGKREADAYGAAASGVNVPVCLGMDNICIPDSAITNLQSSVGLYKDKNIATWAYSCSAWDTVNVKKDTTVKMDKTYIAGSAF